MSGIEEAFCILSSSDFVMNSTEMETRLIGLGITGVAGLEIAALMDDSGDCVLQLAGLLKMVPKADFMDKINKFRALSGRVAIREVAVRIVAVILIVLP